MTNPPATQSQTPTAHGMGEAAPEPSTGVEGKGAPYEPVHPTAEPTTTTISDTPPVTGT
jgi:hypothetical protein